MAFRLMGMRRCPTSRDQRMSSKRNILILSAGRRVELIQAFQQALKRLLPNASVYATDMFPELSAACHIADKAFAAPRATAYEYIDYLLALCDQEGIGMVVPTIDTELNVASKNRARFEAAGVDLVVSTPELVDACRDKRKTARVFETLAISQPAIYERNALRFPCFCKPFDGSRSIGARAILTPEELDSQLLEDEKNMFMELVGKEYREYTIDAYYNQQSELCCLVPRERIEVRDGEVSKGATRKNFVYEYLKDRLKRLTGGRGCITFQVFANHETEDIKALEINPRFGGGYPLAHAAGADYPEWLIREYYFDEKIDFSESWENNLLMLRYDAKVIVHEN